MTDEPCTPADVSEKTGYTPLEMGKTLKRLAKVEMAQQADKNQNLWRVSEKGTAYLQTLLSQQSATGGGATGRPTGRPPSVATGTPTEKPPLAAPSPEPVVPTRSDVLGEIGKRLAIGTEQKDTVKLDAIIHYVQGTANLDELISVWNGLTGTVWRMVGRESGWRCTHKRLSVSKYR